MKLFATLFTIAFCLLGTAYADELPEGHWLSTKLDKAKQTLITYENWFETNEEGEKVFRSKVVSQTPYTAAPVTPNPAPVTPNPAVTPNPSASKPNPLPSSAKGKWICFANDYIAGHTNGDPKDDSCIAAHYKGTGTCQEDAIQRAIAQCHAHSSNKETCEVNPKANCFSEKNFPPRSEE